MPESNLNTAGIISNNWQRVCGEVHAACQAAGRSPDVTIVGVTKYVGPQLAQQLMQAGCGILAENRPQSLWAKYDWFSEQRLQQPAWHLIGHLQRNKVRRTLPMLAYLQSIDSLRLLQVVNDEALRWQRKLPILAEVNVTQDPTKTGMMAAELEPFFVEACQLEGVELCGLMAMSSLTGDSDQVRREFASVRQWRDRLQGQFPQLRLTQLSMGMSGDFPAAIAEGSTIVRIGSHIWRGIVP